MYEKNVFFAGNYLNPKKILKECVMVVITKIVYKITRKKKSKLQLKITYLQDQITQLLSELKRVGDVNESISGKFPEELIDPKILKDALFLCHPDRNGDIERSREVTMWLNQFRDWINGK